jgi:lipopolysaccharide transport system ATP-binding protein
MDSLVVEGLGKCYVLDKGAGHKQSRSLVERLTGRRGASSGEDKADAEFWALKDVSFRLEPGTILGVIGPNGAGKSTLLKILARVIAPTTGRVVGVGRVVSLIELGAGFDPELSARENILMNAALQGIARTEAVKRVDDIIAFAEVERFIDAPLKRYSSGMYLRLAFSVALNMKPHILLADEILAVGDAAFQERCLQAVEQGGRDGLTVLFVSHDMDAIMRVCNRVMWLNRGAVARIGDPEEIVDEYQSAVWAQSDATRSQGGRHANRLAEVLTVRLGSASGKDLGGAPIGEDVFIKVRLRTLRPRLEARCAVDVNSRNQLLFRSTAGAFAPMPEVGVYEALLRIPANLLAESTYTVTVSCGIKKEAALNDPREYPLVVYNALTFMAYASEHAPDTGRLGRAPLIAPKLEWTLRREADAVGA